ncbi:MAG TPA: 5'/3'-nucleotidase SurE, partial [Firmicutes bacterium]|nr:5'/3'-nucleotidase SurE [Bacillota bacterium]
MKKTEAGQNQPPVILVTNDDGIHSPGIRELARALATLGETWIIAPDRERSAVGHSFTINHPIRAKEIEPRVVITDGTPTDCVMFGCLGYLDKRPDLVVSGINQGPNLGDDVTYSGTVAAALEGTMLGVSSMAISLNYPRKKDNSGLGEYHYQTASQVGRLIAEKLLHAELPEKTFLNINVPNVPFEQIRGLNLTRLGQRIYQDRVIRRIDPQGKDYYWIGGEEPSWEKEEGTDFQAIEENKVSVTPITFDLTNYEALAKLQEWA